LLHLVLAASLTISGTSPGFINKGSCEAPVLVPIAEDARLTLYFTASLGSTVAVFDSIPWKLPRRSFAKTWTLDPGNYSIRSWAKLGASYGCDTTISRVVGAGPSRPEIR
jgi:hypothetical protein